MALICLVSCEKDDQFNIEENDRVDIEINKLESLILKDRPANNKWRPYKYNIRGFSTRSGNFESLGMRDFIGFSFRTDISPIEDTRNLGNRVIDISRFSKDYPSYFKSWKNSSHEAKVFSFTSFDDYNDKSEFTNEVTHGSDIKLFGFSLSHKHVYTSTFGQNILNDGKAVFGELNIMLRDSCFRMQYSPSIQKTILKKYLDKAFMEELHSTHPYDFFNSYGAYVATDYSSGGRGQAIYAGLYNKELISQDREGDMSKEINSSYAWEDNKLGGNLKIGRGRESTISTTQSFSSVKVSVKTLGGSASGGFSIPQEVGNSSVDLSGWLSSLSDKSSHVISDFNQNGLIPISDFILEDNLKQLFNKFIDGEVAINPTITEPYINITYRYNPGLAIWTRAWLVTRYGYKIPLSNAYGIYQDGDFSGLIDWIKGINYIFRLSGKIGDTTALNKYGLNRAGEHYGPIIETEYYGDLGANKDKYTKFVNNGILYIVNEFDKVGFSILNNQQMIDEYGLSEFLSTIKQSSVKYEDLIDDNYWINAL